MTREEAIRMLSNRDAHGVPCGYTSGYQEAFDMAVKALEELPKRRKEAKRWKRKALQAEPNEVAEQEPKILDTLENKQIHKD